VAMTMSTAREARRNSGNRENYRRRDQLSHLYTCQSVSIAPTSACATTTPLTLALP
jgi:hypothetical protein